jgi:hypothetical protein
MLRLILATGAVVGAIAAAQATPSRAPAELETMRQSFAAAVKSNDRKAAEALSAFPLTNNVYQEPSKIPAAKFPGQFKMYRELSKCISNTALQPVEGKAGQWEIDCDGNILRFGTRQKRWLHTGFENVNE